MKLEVDQKEEKKEESKGGDFDIYNDKIVFLEPMFVIDGQKHRCFTFKVNLERFMHKAKNMCRQAICLLNRSNNKQLFLNYMTSLLVNKKLNLFSVSMIFMKICQVYKQASLERQSIKKKAVQMTNY